MGACPWSEQIFFDKLSFLLTWPCLFVRLKRSPEGNKQELSFLVRDHCSLIVRRHSAEMCFTKSSPEIIVAGGCGPRLKDGGLFRIKGSCSNHAGENWFGELFQREYKFKMLIWIV